MATTTWNPADLLNMTLNTGNLNAHSTAVGGVRSIGNSTTGKHYFEISFAATGSTHAIGLAIVTATLSTVASTGTGSAQVNNGGGIAVNGSVQTGVGVFSAGGICCIAIDVDGRLIWFRNGAAGNWNGSGSANPATGAGGYSVSALGAVGTPLYAISCSTTGNLADTLANFGDSAFTGVVPSGFSAGFPTAPSAAQARAMVLA